MISFLKSIRLVPWWAGILVIIVLTVNTLYLYYRYHLPYGVPIDNRNGQYVVTDINPESPCIGAGIKKGDILLKQNGEQVTPEYLRKINAMAGDTLRLELKRGERTYTTWMICDRGLKGLGLYVGIYLAMLLISISSVYILVKQPGILSAKLFFLYIQLFAIASNAGYLPFQTVLATIINETFIFSGSMMGIVLIHFHLLFPKPVPLLQRFSRFPLVLYVMGIMVFTLFAYGYFRWVTDHSEEGDAFFIMTLHLSLKWTTATFLAALVIAVYQYFRIRETLARNQVRLLILGSFFVFMTPMMLTFFYDWVAAIQIPFIVELSQATGNLSMIAFLLVAMFRYRIWEVELVIKKALLYLGATVIIILTYLLLIWVVELVIVSENDLIRFMMLCISVIIFLVLRDNIQGLIDRLFHREKYDSAAVVTGFESKLAGVYRFDELKQQIVKAMNEIFHFKSLVFILKKNGLNYGSAIVYGDYALDNFHDIILSTEFETKLKRKKVFSPVELYNEITEFPVGGVELVIPMVSNGQPHGFFLCGQKKSERIYSRQDIQLLLLLASRSISLLQTAILYNKDMERRLTLERERTRISRDMHDDVGASLTRISILSEMAKNNSGISVETKQWLCQISDTSRGVIEEMSQIIWSLNPKNDTLEGLVAYLRRFANEYFEPTLVACVFELPEKIPDLPLTVEVRRNIYLVVRETLHNVVKHSEANKVRVCLEVNQHDFSISIQDNGNGFDKTNYRSGGNGLINMQKRMNDIGGEFVINTNHGSGTEILLKAKTFAKYTGII